MLWKASAAEDVGRFAGVAIGKAVAAVVVALSRKVQESGTTMNT